MKHAFITTLSITGVCLIFAGCATPPPPQRITTGGPEALTTRGLDMQDLMDTAQRATRELLVAPAITQFKAQNGRLPRLDVGKISNNTRERITIEQVSERIMEALLDSELVTLVAHDSGAKTASALDDFLGDKKINLADQADFYLEGTILGQTVTQGRMLENNYSFMLRLNDRNRSQVWKRTLDITKPGRR